MPTNTTSAPALATARPDGPESIGEILPRVLAALDPDRRRRKLTPHELALLDADVRALAPIMEDFDDER